MHEAAVLTSPCSSLGAGIAVDSVSILSNSRHINLTCSHPGLSTFIPVRAKGVGHLRVLLIPSCPGHSIFVTGHSITHARLSIKNVVDHREGRASGAHTSCARYRCRISWTSAIEYVRRESGRVLDVFKKVFKWANDLLVSLL